MEKFPALFYWAVAILAAFVALATTIYTVPWASVFGMLTASRSEEAT